MIFMDIVELNHNLILNNIIAEIINNSANLNHQNLYNILSEVIAETDSFLLISIEEYDMDEIGSNIQSKPTGEGKELLKKDQRKRQKILIIIYYGQKI